MSGRQNFFPYKAVLMVIVVAVFAAAVIIIVSVTGKKRDREALEPGIDYIRQMESKDTASIEDRIFNASRQKQLEEMRAQIEKDPDQVWRLLSELNTVFMGDSRVVGFDVFGYVDESHVLAAGGATIRDIPDSYDTLQILNPRVVVLAYGINDINNYWLWDTLEEYIAELNDTMATLTSLLPNACIYVQSIIPASEAGLEDSPSWGVIPDWNAAIKANCAEMGWRYLDITDLVYEHWDLYDVDGVHMQTFFYPYWAEAILLQYLADTE